MVVGINKSFAGCFDPILDDNWLISTFQHERLPGKLPVSPGKPILVINLLEAIDI